MKPSSVYAFGSAAFLAKAWRRWLKFTEFLGNIQITIVLSLIYWTLLLVWAFPYKVFNDRLALRNPARARWIHRIPGASWLDSMRKQG